MALSGAFSSMLITAQRHWWKGILKLWRHSTVFSLSFDYIPNYGASKQLNQAWMFEQIQMAVELCCCTLSTAQLFFFFYQWVWERNVCWKTILITRVNSIRVTSPHISWWFYVITVCCLCVWERSHIQRERLLAGTVLPFFFFFLWSKHKRQFCL